MADPDDTDAEDERPPNKGGRPRFEPLDQQRQMVTVLAAHGIPHESIARRVFHPEDLDGRGRPRAGARPITPKTLRRAFPEELSNAHETVKVGMIQSIIRAAQAGHWGAARYWLATQGGPEWRITEGRVIAGDPDAAPVRVSIDQMSDDDIKRELDDIREQRRVAARARAMAESVPKRSNGVGH